MKMIRRTKSDQIGGCFSSFMRFLSFFLAATLVFAACFPAALMAQGKGEPESVFIEQLVDAENLRGLIRHSYQQAENWFLNSIKPDNTFVYLYDPVRRKYADYNNAIRQLMASRLLAELASENPDLVETHVKNMNYIFLNWYEENGKIGYIYFNEKSSLGASGIALRAIAQSPFADRYERKARRLVQGVISIMNPDGSFEPFIIDPPEDEKKDKDFLLSYYSGEAILGLLEHYKRFGDERALAAAKKAQDFYLEHYVEKLTENYRPFYVPWHTMSLYTLYGITGDKRCVDAIFRLNDELLKIQDTEKYPGRFAVVNGVKYKRAHSASDGVYTESLAYALDVAKKEKDAGREAKYLRAVDLAVKNLVSLQFTNSHAPLFVGDSRVPGGIRIRTKTFKIRIDCVQHTMDAYRKLLKVL